MLNISLWAIDFDLAWQNRVAGELDDLPVFFIGRAELVRNKESTGPPKDKIDAVRLRRGEPA